VSKCGQIIYEINNAKLSYKVDTKKSGQKVSTQNWLNLYLGKILLRAGKREECTVDPATGQKYPGPPPQEAYYGKWWESPFTSGKTAGDTEKELNRKVKIDWDRWEDED